VSEPRPSKPPPDNHREFLERRGPKEQPVSPIEKWGHPFLVMPARPNRCGTCGRLRSVH
jgi:hypothetical protein